MSDTAPPRARRGRKEVVSAAVIEAVALRLWAERGFPAVSVADIAAEAGVTGRTIFRRYLTKEDILWGPLTVSFQVLTDALERTSPPEPLLERARTALVGMLRDGDADPTSRQRLRIFGLTPELHSSTSAPFQLWRQILHDFALAQSGVDPLRAQVFAWSVQSTALAGLIWWAEQEPGTAPWEVVDRAFARVKD